jgi:hypothetical protein
MMIQVKIIKDYKMLKAGDTPMVDEAYAALLMKKGAIAKPEKADKK